MRWKRLWAFESPSDLLTLCAVVVGWEVATISILASLALLLDGVALGIWLAGVALLVVPAAYTALAVIAFLRRKRG